MRSKENLSKTNSKKGQDEVASPMNSGMRTNANGRTNADVTLVAKIRMPPSRCRQLPFRHVSGAVSGAVSNAPICKRLISLVGAGEFELPTPCSRSKSSPRELSGDWPETGPSRMPPGASKSSNIGLLEPPTDPTAPKRPVIHLGILTGIPLRNAWVGGSIPSCGTSKIKDLDNVHRSRNLPIAYS